MLFLHLLISNINYKIQEEIKFGQRLKVTNHTNQN